MANAIVNSNEVARGGTATAQIRALIARGSRLFCEREHELAIALGRAPAGVACCPHCVLYPIGGQRG